LPANCVRLNSLLVSDERSPPGAGGRKTDAPAPFLQRPALPCAYFFRSDRRFCESSRRSTMQPASQPAGKRDLIESPYYRLRFTSPIRSVAIRHARQRRPFSVIPVLSPGRTFNATALLSPGAGCKPVQLSATTCSDPRWRRAGFCRRHLVSCEMVMEK